VRRSAHCAFGCIPSLLAAAREADELTANSAWRVQKCPRMNNSRHLPTLTALTIAMSTFACSSAVTAPKHAPPARTCSSAHITGEASVQALAGCTRIRGDLRIEKSTLKSLAGLESLRTITGNLHIADNPNLETLSGLEGLRSVDTLVVCANPKLEHLGGLHGLRKARRIAVEKSPELDDLEGLDGVRTLESLALIRTGISSVRGLSNVVSVGDLVVVSNPRLVGLGGFIQVRAAESVRVIDNRRLAGQAFLTELEAVSGPVVIEGNSSLAKSEVDALVQRLSAHRETAVAAR
jgi:hypothetical protein